MSMDMEVTMAHEAIAANARRLRKRKGLSQEKMAKAAGLSLAGYRNIETGRSIPRVDTLYSLASAMEVPVQELLAPVLELRAVRFRSFKRLRSRDQVLSDVARWLKDFNELEQVLDELRVFSLDGSKGSNVDQDRPSAAAQWVRGRFSLSPNDPVRDLSGLLEANGVKVLPLEIKSDAFFGLSVAPDDGGPAIVVNTWDRISVERWIFSAAHELGHLVLHLGDYNVEEEAEAKGEEQEANIFAGHFLMPAEVFRREWDDTYGMSFVDRVMKVKRIFRVSYKTVLYRLSETATDKAEIWRGFQIDYQRRYGKTLHKLDEPEALAADAFRASSPEPSSAGEPERLSKADFIEDRLSRLVRRAVEKSLITLSRGAEILGLSLQEMRELSAAWVE